MGMPHKAVKHVVREGASGICEQEFHQNQSHSPNESSDQAHDATRSFETEVVTPCHLYGGNLRDNNENAAKDGTHNIERWGSITDVAGGLGTLIDKGAHNDELAQERELLGMRNRYCKRN